jgi:hypothetical protein
MAAVLSIVLALAPASVSVLSAPVQDPGSPDTQTEEARISQEAWFTSPLTDALPPFFTQEVPPGVVCILAPELCGPDIQAVLEPIEQILGDLEIPVLPVQSVLPGTLPVGLMGGHQRYASFVEFELPDLPEGEAFEHFELILHEEGVSYALESPAFREAVSALVDQVADEPSLERFVRYISEVAEGEHELLESQPTGIEACPALESWEAGDNQEANTEADVDCVRGTTATREPDGTWRLDLTFAVQSWVNGDEPNHGLSLRPLPAITLDYGDPDISTNFQVSLAGSEGPEELRPQVSYSVGEAPEIPDLDPVPELPPDPPPAPADGGTSPRSCAPSPRRPSPLGYRWRHWSSCSGIRADQENQRLPGQAPARYRARR